ncbi:DUF4148 domain-containing protein [Pandoraea sputorum]|uniref:DUF4148 domain-containing protein n=1 Tax=Pandoraea sputorum TaxID=93222 RepID=UPI002AF6C692|nr:DUF4148 domain-containing protein [Pandoraea sputorum]BET11203.1 DUF4148 domain-containing protein [Pandoraea sputorum]
MKAIVSALLVSCAIAAPFSAFAQSTGNTNAPLTRAQVRADLIRYESAGYRPTGSELNYPANIERVSAIVAQRDAHAGVANVKGGAGASGVSTGNQPVTDADGNSLYFGD